MALTLKYQTKAQLLTRLRERYRTLSKHELAKLAAWLYDRYVDGDFTAAQIRTAFGLDTQAKWDVFRIKIQTLRDQYVAIDGAVGE
jgi:glutathione S-transferase